MQKSAFYSQKAKRDLHIKKSDNIKTQPPHTAKPQGGKEIMGL